MGPAPAALIRDRYKSDNTELRSIAAMSLGYARDDKGLVYGLQAQMAFEDAGVWQRNLTFLGDGEAEFTCPSCSEELLLNLEKPPCRVGSYADELLAPAASHRWSRPERHMRAGSCASLVRRDVRLLLRSLRFSLAARSARDFAHLSASRALWPETHSHQRRVNA